MAVVTMKQLLEAGVHFGHQTRRWNPKMRRFIFGERNGIYIIDLSQTLDQIDKAYRFVRSTVEDGGTVLFVGTKKQSQDSIEEMADRCGMPYVNQRWLGGMLTNFQTVHARVSKMHELDQLVKTGETEAMPKKEALRITRELTKLKRNLGGIKDLTKPPDAIFVIDTKKEHIAVTEANRLGIPVVAVVDTNCDPDLVQYVIPGNDDAIRSAALLARVISDAAREGRAMQRAANTRPPTTEADAEAAGLAPIDPEELRRKEEQQQRARAEAAKAQADRERKLAADKQAKREAKAAPPPPPPPPPADVPVADAAAPAADASTTDAPTEGATDG